MSIGRADSQGDRAGRVVWQTGSQGKQNRGRRGSCISREVWRNHTNAHPNCKTRNHHAVTDSIPSHKGVVLAR